LEEEARIRQILPDAGLRVLDAETGKIRVEGLNIYYFGDKNPLPLWDLLVYWQD